MDHGPDPPDTADDRILVERVRRGGDMAAFEVLYRRHVDAVHRFAYRRSGSRTVADDITSATFERALAKLPAFRWRGGGFVPWLYRIASNELADHFRDRQRLQTATGKLDPPEAGDVETAVLTSLDAAEVRDALSRLNPRYQRVLSLRYLAGLSHAEVAQAMGIPRRLLAVTVHRAMNALGRELGVDRSRR